MQIYSTGYTGKDINELKPMLSALDAVLVDVRFSPNSQVLHWRQMYLKILLKHRYLHVPNLGNRTYKEDKITIQNLRLGVETLVKADENAVLFCACEKVQNCHRRYIIEALNKQNIEVKELKTWKVVDSGNLLWSNLF
jgi:uncharacterized protein (DUF488 family)